MRLTSAQLSQWAEGIEGGNPLQPGEHLTQQRVEELMRETDNQDTQFDHEDVREIWLRLNPEKED